MTNNLQRRFIEASSKYEMSEEAHETMVNHAEGFGGAELIYKYYRRFVLAFIAQEFELAAQEVEKDFAYKFGRGKYEELVHTEMLPFLAAIIRNWDKSV